ncbi:M55 family metallopeptidase [Streptomyces sp. NPDC101194]|uniref:M55 family metallopeptidase n=1 Tax=Streptomyces sp. NPDC101194 TaxID=3366127 RepID=UPI003830D791
MIARVRGRGKSRSSGMLGGLDEHTDAVMPVGHHARAGGGPAHTMSDDIPDVRVAGRVGRWTFLLAARGVRGSSGCVRSLPAHSPRAGASCVLSERVRVRRPRTGRW